jgi:DNA polymerase/3'-5' exonuclease PolX
MSLKIKYMNEESITKDVKNEILIKNFNRYFEILEKSNQEPFKNNSWREIQLLYSSLDEDNKENLKEFAK